MCIAVVHISDSNLGMPNPTIVGFEIPGLQNLAKNCNFRMLITEIKFLAA